MKKAFVQVLVFHWFAVAYPVFAATPDKVVFSTHIKPILSDRCFFCHGPDAEKREADLRLDLEDAAKEYAIAPGEPAESELIARITHADPAERMPPAESKLSLTDDEIELIRRWIQQGAKWESHWSFIAPAVTPVPKRDNDTWARNEIDRFVLRRLEQEKLAPAPTATREQLIRRLTFDLIGLPPTLAEIDAFLTDTSPRAYETLVDRLLRSSSHGERLTADWLDVARYSDTFGYQVDRDRHVWPWRDWVIRAFNANMPYDRFVTEQLAGDLLPDATDEQVLATTFNRLHPQKVEGGSTPEEFRIEYVADRNQTFATAMLGLTMECCRCHDHKYDPITQREYYQLSAFFDNIDEAGLYSYFTPSVPTPTLLLADEATKAKLASMDDEITKAEQKLSELRKSRQLEFAAWVPPTEAKPIGRVAHMDFEHHKSGANLSVSGPVGKAVQLSGDDGIGLKVGNFRRAEPFSVALWMNTPDEKERAVVFHRSGAWTDAASRGYQLLIKDGRLSASLIHFWPGNAISISTREKISTARWLHVAVTYDGSSRADGLNIFIDGQPADTEIVRDNLYKHITGGGGDNLAIGQRFRDRGFTKGLVDEFQVFKRQLTPIEVAQIHDNQSLTDALRSDPVPDALYPYYLSTADAAYQAQLETLRVLRDQRNKVVDGVQEIMVMRELSERRPTYLLNRGAYDNRGDQVFPDTPSALSPFPRDAPRNRLGLAAWLTDSDNPLMARVAVNRYWQLLIGEGLVRTPEDFGSQGRLPTHPELLDWLAADFVENGWDLRRLLKQIVMSATYRQSSSAGAELRARDPENQFLARAFSHRLSAEMLRDNALAVSGLLVDKIGGPPAKPYEVAVSFKPTKRAKGAGLYRRSVYTYWKRTGPAPVMMTLDAAKRDVCRVKRERTLSPLETFVMMNGPQFVEAARLLSQKLIQQHGDQSDAVITDLFRVLTSRRPTDVERKVLDELYAKQLTYFSEEKKRAHEFLKTGDSPRDPKIDVTQLAATAAVANALMSFDECITRR